MHYLPVLLKTLKPYLYASIQLWILKISLRFLEKFSGLLLRIFFNTKVIMYGDNKTEYSMLETIGICTAV